MRFYLDRFLSGPQINEMRFLVLALSLSILAAPAAHAQAGDSFEALRQQDLRLARISEQIMQANAGLCTETMPLTGIILHSADQYSNGDPEWFANGHVAISALVAGSPAELAGLQANDGAVAIDGKWLREMHQAEDAPLRDSVFDRLAGIDASDGLVLTYRRGEIDRTLRLKARPGCRALVEILADTGSTALSDGRVVQISYGMATELDDEELALVFAHELAPSVLHHRRRREEAGVSKGLFSEFGRNRRLNRQVEIEADMLSVHLLANAGYDPHIAPQFWRSDAADNAGGGLLRSRIYPSRASRAEMMEEEIGHYLKPGDDQSWPAHLLDRRERPFEDD